MFETLPFSVRQTFRVLTPGFCHPEPDSGSRCFSLRSFSVLFLPSSFLPSLLFLLYFLILLLFSPFSSFLFSLSSFLFLPSSLFSFLLLSFSVLFLPSLFLSSSLPLLSSFYSVFFLSSLFSLLPPFLLFFLEIPELALSTRSRDDRLGVRRLPAG